MKYLAFVVLLFLLLLVPVCFAQTATTAAAIASSIPIQARVLMIAGIVFGVMQVLKNFIPGLGGWYALAFNIVFSVVGVIVGVQPAQLFSLTTLLAIISTAAAAAGIHGTATKLAS